MDDSSDAEKIELNGVQTVVVVETGDIQETEGEDGNGEEGRETWGKKADFLLSVIGFAVDLANVWRFPYLCYRNGGGAFLIPYLLMLIFGGIPLFYMELALGQYIRKGAITCWGRICPLFKGVGYTVVMIAFFTDFFYNVVIAWSLYYLFASFTSSLPWTSCNNTWNSETCSDVHLQYVNQSEDSNIVMDASDSTGNFTGNFTINVTKPVTTYPADEFYNFAVLGISDEFTLTNLGSVQWKLALCLLVVYIICYFSLWKGISMSGKVVWFTAVFPYVVLFILLIRGVTLEGSMTGIQYYITPKVEKLKEGRAWLDAATQVFFSLGPGFGVLLAYASYNRFNNNVYRDALFTSAINSATSFMSGFVVFSVLGYMALKRKVDIEKVVDEGPGLVFAVYPEALATLPGSNFWSVIFFMMLLTLGLDSSFGGSEAVITALSDEFPIVKRRREVFVLILFVLYFCIGIMEVTQGGIYLFTLFERYCVQYSILIAVLFETIIVSWIYGVDRFRKNIQEMMGQLPGRYWMICWKFIAPIFIMYNIIYGLMDHRPLTLKGWQYPPWSNAIGWILAMLSVFFIPFIAIVQIIKTPGSLRHRIMINLQPYQDTHGRNAVIY